MYNENASFYLAVWSVLLLLIGSVCALCRPDNWCNIPLSALDHFSLLKLFSELPLKSNKRAWESRARTVSLSLQQTGPAATWRVTGKTQHPADSQRAPRQQRDPGPGYLGALKRRDRWPPFGLLHIAPHRRRWNHTTLHLGWADNPRNQNITISAEWTIARAGIMSPAENTHTCTCAENVHKHQICHLGQLLRQGFRGTADLTYPATHTITQTNTRSPITETIVAPPSIFGIIGLAPNRLRWSKLQTEENSYRKSTQSEK